VGAALWRRAPGLRLQARPVSAALCPGVSRNTLADSRSEETRCSLLSLQRQPAIGSDGRQSYGVLSGRCGP
jgi:hypothetical protein